MFGPGLTLGPVDDLGDFSFVLFSGVFAVAVNVTLKRIQNYLLEVRIHRLLNRVFCIRILTDLRPRSVSSEI